MTSGATHHTHPRDRLLGTAARLFYENGIHTVGVEQLVTEAKVTRATFYRHFAGKEGLVLSYLRQRDARVRQEVAAVLAAHQGREALLAIMAMIGDSVRRPGFRGCGFLNAAAEHPDPGHPVRRCVAEHRRWFLGVLRDAADAAGHPEPEDLARTLVVLRDGAMAGGYLDDLGDVAETLRKTTERLLDS
ncbi:TetR/AcrR family transcriptional regulator [Streptomyces olivaceoviridis]|uniref:TetR/AcrR family transcriptional regulator n=1 Tax=Streptomyces olivaceoviridis TaxID=1921 RepID=UPI001678F4EF|nr:TetR/AcrR family transcriptional regulator [Streptomyces olivaceoviridis]GGZ03385.1 TetR family transcriptional regulator [Streptomyces olivaceoviridis]